MLDNYPFHSRVEGIFSSFMKRIVLTGGPCAGKTTALVKIIEHFSSLGYKVFIIPEVPTLFRQAGMDYLTDNYAFFYEGEKATLEMQIALEEKFTRIAETIEEPTIIVCDRGTMDISAYMKPAMWQDITSALSTDSERLRARYDAVLHLVSAADGAEQFYTTATNAERTEGLELARELDKKVISAWSEHPRLRVINNHENFDTKINRVLQEISNVLEIPQQVIEERKYIVRLIGDIPGAIESDIKQTYLTSEPRSEVRLRRRTLNEVSVNVRTTKKTLPTNEQVETERQIDNNLYESLMRQADPYRYSIHKIRKTFIWRGQFFELDTYLEPISNLQILETKGIVDHEDVNFPPFLEVLEDITGKTEYYNYNLALKR